MNDAYSFCFDGWQVGEDRQSLLFRYAMKVKDSNRQFTEEIRLPQPIPAPFPQPLLNALMQNLHLILGLSYWKLTCPKNIELKQMQLDQQQAQFWDTVYTKGLGEFFYRNNIDFRGLVRFPFDRQPAMSATPVAVGQQSLVGIAGGKDSLLSARLMDEEKLPYTALVFETGKSYPLIEEILPFIQAPALKIRRIIDPQLFELNGQGVYNGHIPISAVYAFLGLSAACFYGYRYVVVSNEKSASYGNIMYSGMEVNHQWSKSEEFERLFGDYIRRYITPSVTYFSLLRPLNELQIVEKFVRYPEYLTHFSSCNRNFKILGDTPKKWCGSCPKCAFVFSLLAAFLPKEHVVKLFGKNMFEDEALLPTYRQLLGLADFKPFECVGTPDEVSQALSLIHKKHEFDQTPVMNMFVNEAKQGMAAVRPAPGPIDLLPMPFAKLMDKLL